MRLFVALIVSLILTAPILLMTALAHGQEPDFPYEAIVLAEEAAVFSGPGSVHYTTDLLEQGRRVEVYRHDPDGWCAIRPPFGSFSLVPEGALTLVSADVATILEDDTRAWVGTKTGVVEAPLWQVKLNRGEMVEVIGEVSWPDPAGHSTIWYQVAPPAGEFRWMRLSDLQLPELPQVNRETQDASMPVRFASNEAMESQIAPPPAVSFQNQNQPAAVNESSQQAGSGNGTFEFENVVQASAISDSNSPAYDGSVRQAAGQDEGTAGVAPRIQSPEPVTAESLNSGWRRSTIPGRQRNEPVVMDNIPNTFTAPAVPAGGSLQQAMAVRPADHTASLEAWDNQGIWDGEVRQTASLTETPALEVRSEMREARQASFSDLSTSSTGAALRELDIRLSREMVETPDRWRLDSIRAEVESVIAGATEHGDRVFAGRLMDKIRNCTYLKEQYSRQAEQEPALFGTGIRQASATGVTGSGVEQAVMLDTTYDAHGWLNELVRENGAGTSTYVLQDESGKITHHIAAVPGLNLHRYLKQEVGIIGQRGYNRRLKLDHVTAQRIIELNTLNR